MNERACRAVRGLLITAPPQRGTASQAKRWARSSAGEHYVDIVGVTGSIPVAPTIFCQARSKIRTGRLRWPGNGLATGWQLRGTVCPPRSPAASGGWRRMLCWPAPGLADPSTDQWTIPRNAITVRQLSERCLDAAELGLAFVKRRREKAVPTPHPACPVRSSASAPLCAWSEAVRISLTAWREKRVRPIGPPGVAGRTIA